MVHPVFTCPSCNKLMTGTCSSCGAWYCSDCYNWHCDPALFPSSDVPATQTLWVAVSKLSRAVRVAKQ
jgi:ribosomal protein L37AE/L43A